MQQQICRLRWKYWAEAQRTSSTASQVVLCYHAGNLISEVHGLSWQHIRIEMHDPSTCHIVAGRRLLSCMLVELCNRSEPPLAVLEGKGSVGLCLRLLNWDRRRFVGLSCWNSSSTPASMHSAHDWPSPALPVSMGAGVSERAGVSVTGASVTGVSVTGASMTGAAITLVLGSLELVVWVSAFICDSRRDSLGVT